MACNWAKASACDAYFNCSWRGFESVQYVSGFVFQAMELRVEGTQGSGCGVQGLGLRVQGKGFRFRASGFRMRGSGFKFQGKCHRKTALQASRPFVGHDGRFLCALSGRLLLGFRAV